MTTQRVRRVANAALRTLVAAGLAADAYVHADLAPVYDGIHASISQGDLFRIEAGLAAAAALIVIVAGRRAEFRLAFVVAASALGALLLYRYSALLMAENHMAGTGAVLAQRIVASMPSKFTS